MQIKSDSTKSLSELQVRQLHAEKRGRDAADRNYQSDRAAFHADNAVTPYERRVAAQSAGIDASEAHKKALREDNYGIHAFPVQVAKRPRGMTKAAWAAEQKEIAPIVEQKVAKAPKESHRALDARNSSPEYVHVAAQGVTVDRVDLKARWKNNKTVHRAAGRDMNVALDVQTQKADAAAIRIEVQNETILSARAALARQVKTEVPRKAVAIELAQVLAARQNPRHTGPILDAAGAGGVGTTLINPWDVLHGRVV